MGLAASVGTVMIAERAYMPPTSTFKLGKLACDDDDLMLYGVLHENTYFGMQPQASDMFIFAVTPQALRRTYWYDPAAADPDASGMAVINTRNVGTPDHPLRVFGMCGANVQITFRYQSLIGWWHTESTYGPFTFEVSGVPEEFIPQQQRAIITSEGGL